MIIKLLGIKDHAIKYLFILKYVPTSNLKIDTITKF